MPQSGSLWLVVGVGGLLVVGTALWLVRRRKAAIPFARVIASPAPAVPIPLDYAPAPPWYRTRRLRRRVALVVLAAAIGCGIRWGPPAFKQARMLWWQHQCRAYAAPADEVVYDEDPIAAGKLIALGGDYHGENNPVDANAQVACKVPQCYQRFRDVISRNHYDGAIVYLGERALPDGRPCIVAVYFQNFAPGAVRYGHPLAAVLIEPAPLTGEPRVIPHLSAMGAEAWVGGTHPTIRFFAGQPDPRDRTRFTIQYEQEGKRGQVFGQIMLDRGELEVFTTTPSGIKY